MDPATSDSQVQTGVATDPATASPAPQTSTATETIPQSPEAAAKEANDALLAHYNSPAKAATSAAVEKTDEQAQATAPVEATTPAPAVENTETPAPSPEEQAKAAEAEEQSKGRYRLKGKDALIAALAKEEGISIDEAADRYRGIAKPAPAKIPGIEDVQPPSPVDALTGEVTKISTRVGEIDAKMKSLKESGDRFTDEYQDLADEKADLAIQYADKKAELKDAEREVKQRDGAVRQSHEQIIAAQETNKAEAFKAFPSISDPESDLYAVTTAVVAEMRAAGDPDLNKPDAPMIVAEKSANRLAAMLEKSAGIPKATTLARVKPGAPAPVPAKAVAPAPLSSPAAVVKPAPPRVNPASGSASQAPNTQPSTVGELFASVETAEQGNQALLQYYGGPQQGRRPGS